MPLAQLLPSTGPATEPVSVADAVAEWRLPVDISLTDEVTTAELRLIARKLQAARELVEGYTGDYFAGSRTLALTYELQEIYHLPVGAVVDSVTGFFASVADLEAFSWEEYRKGISINRELSLWEASRQTYTVTVTLPAEVSEYAPALVKEAILELGGEFYRNRESSADAGRVPHLLPVAYQVKLASLVRKPILF